MTKICTSIEQSKKLLELGLDPSTADTFYATETGTLIVDVPYEIEGYEPCVPFVPAWSLTALLELMPAFIRNYQLTINKEGDVYDISYNDIFSIESAILYADCCLIDAAFEMICWLIKQGHVKINK